MTFLEILLKLMMILMFLTGAGVLDDVLDDLQMPWGCYVWSLLKSVEFKGIKNTLKDWWLSWRFGGCWMFLAGAGVLDHELDVSFKVHWISVSIFVKIWWLEVNFWQFCFNNSWAEGVTPRVCVWVVCWVAGLVAGGWISKLINDHSSYALADQLSLPWQWWYWLISFSSLSLLLYKTMSLVRG